MSPAGARRTDDEPGEPPGADKPSVRLGPALARAWVGYRRQLDAELADAGFADKTFPDGRVLRICRGSRDMTIAQIGRELGITRQGASKIVASLTERGYLTLAPSPTNGREKIVTLTPRATALLAARRRAAERVECELRERIGDDKLEELHALLHALAGDQQPRIGDYLRQKARNVIDPTYLDE